jgi:transposase
MLLNFVSRKVLAHQSLSAIPLLTTGSERAGQRAAAIQTLLGTAQLNGRNPSDWLKDTLTKLPTWPNSRIDELLPLPSDFIETMKQKV